MEENVHEADNGDGKNEKETGKGGTVEEMEKNFCEAENGDGKEKKRKDLPLLMMVGLWSYIEIFIRRKKYLQVKHPEVEFQINLMEMMTV